MKLLDAVKKELKRSATNPHDAIFLRMLKNDFENGHFNTERMQKVREKYARGKTKYYSINYGLIFGFEGIRKRKLRNYTK